MDSEGVCEETDTTTTTVMAVMAATTKITTTTKTITTPTTTTKTPKPTNTKQRREKRAPSPSPINVETNMKTKGVFDFKFVVPSAIFFSILLALALSVGQGFPFATSFEEWLSDGAAKDIFPFSSRMLVPEGEVPSRKKNGADIERAVRGDRRRRNDSTELSYLDGAVEHLKYPIV